MRSDATAGGGGCGPAEQRSSGPADQRIRGPAHHHSAGVDAPSMTTEGRNRPELEGAQVLQPLSACSLRLRSAKPHRSLHTPQQAETVFDNYLSVRCGDVNITTIF